MKHISKEQKEAIIYSYKNGKPVKSISEQTGIPRSTIYDWIRAEQPISEELPLNKTTINNLKRTNEKQAAIIEVLQRAFDVDSMPTQIRLQMLEELYGEYNVYTLCDALKVPRGTLYNHMLRNKRDNTWYATKAKKMISSLQFESRVMHFTFQNWNHLTGHQS